ncbi:MAG: TRAP transporter substrate-binding protein [Pseudomonadota bacterium]
MLKSILFATATLLPLGFTQLHAAEFNWDQSTEYGVNSINTKTDVFFADRLKELSEDRINITIHSGAALGFREKDHLFAVADGALPIATTVSGTLAGVDPIFLLSSLPFVAKDFDDVRALWKIARPYYEEVFEKYDQKLIHAGWIDPSGIWANGEIKSVDDLKSLRIRTYDATGTRVLDALGASPLQISWSDVVPQLATGSISAVLTGVDGGAAANFWDYTNSFTQINYAMPLTFVHMNMDAYNALPPELQEAVMQAGEEATEWRAKQISQNQAAKYDELRSHNMTVVEKIDDELVTKLSEAAQPVIDDWKAKAGDSAEEILAKFSAK